MERGLKTERLFGLGDHVRSVEPRSRWKKLASNLAFTANPFADASALGEIARMGSVTRALFSLVLAVAILATVISQPATALEAEVAMASMHCCDDDCPQDPACDMACMAMMRCATGSMGLVPLLPLVNLSLADAGDAHGADPPSRVDELHPDALKRPPRI